ncbi:hypothetical protein BH10PSE4_BH10PSE4_25290 [soil metagenome]
MNGTQPLVFVHIPRTAGTSLVEGIGRLCRSPASFAPDHLPAAAADIRGGRYDFINGHFTYAKFVELCGADYRFVTFVRHPVDRLLSDYAYSTSDRHPGADEIRTNYPNFVRYCAEPAFHDAAMRYLALPGETPRQAADRMLDNYLCVGNVDTYADDYRRLLDAFEKGEAPQLRLNTVERAEAGHHVKEIIERSSARDMELYAALCEVRRGAA